MSEDPLANDVLSIFHTSSCRLGVALPMLHGVYCFRRRVILCSSTSDAQNVFANEERFQVTHRRKRDYLATGVRAWMLFVHAVRRMREA